jgi:hypothetical protein
MGNLHNYKPVSNCLNIDFIKNSPKTIIKRFKESVYFGEVAEDGKRNGCGVMIYASNRLYEG